MPVQGCIYTKEDWNASDSERTDLFYLKFCFNL